MISFPPLFHSPLFTLPRFFSSRTLEQVSPVAKQPAAKDRGGRGGAEESETEDLLEDFFSSRKFERVLNDSAHGKTPLSARGRTLDSARMALPPPPASTI